MPPATRRTSMLRVVLALAFAYLLPALALGQAFYWTQESDGPRTALLAAGFIAPSLVMGLLMGWPYVAGAAGCWAVLDYFNRHHAWSAVVVGLMAGAGVAVSGLRSAEFTHRAFCLALGAVTGLGVWWIAYGRQGRLPAPALPKAA